ncbi:MAG: hypothetical protein LBQ73_00845 [Tannerellaceae bacterium]|nr:hypothetical protein [Tannerellaceae bacterium]
MKQEIKKEQAQPMNRREFFSASMAAGAFTILPNYLFAANRNAFGRARAV